MHCHIKVIKVNTVRKEGKHECHKQLHTTGANGKLLFERDERLTNYIRNLHDNESTVLCNRILETKRWLSQWTRPILIAMREGRNVKECGTIAL